MGLTFEQSVIKMVKPLIPAIEAMIEQEALKVIGTTLPALGEARLLEVTPKVIEKLTVNGYASFPDQRPEDPSHPEHSLANATAYYVAMEMEGEGFESDVIAGGVQGLCMESPDFKTATAELSAAAGDESTYVHAVGTAVIATVSAWAAKQATAAIAKVPVA